MMDSSEMHLCTGTLTYNFLTVMFVFIYVGDDLGLDSDPSHLELPPMNPLSTSHKTPEDYVFVHTDSHREFMDLLLEKRKQLESNISSKEREPKTSHIVKEEQFKKDQKIEQKVNIESTSSELMLQ